MFIQIFNWDISIYSNKTIAVDGAVCVTNADSGKMLNITLMVAPVIWAEFAFTQTPTMKSAHVGAGNAEAMSGGIGDLT